MNTTYTLIKTDSNFILCDIVIIKATPKDESVYDGIRMKHFIEDEMTWHKHTEKKSDIPLGMKLIASLNKIEGVPTLTFDEVVAREIRYIDAKKLAEINYQKYSATGKELSFDEEVQRVGGYQIGFIEGYLQAIEDNKERLYTKDDIEKAISFGFGQSAKNGFVSINEESEFINSIIKTSWKVEIEMKHFDDLDMITHVRMSSPKITNNSIKITKII